jgi:hypothetical protein
MDEIKQMRSNERAGELVRIDVRGAVQQSTYAAPREPDGRAEMDVETPSDSLNSAREILVPFFDMLALVQEQVLVRRVED